MGMNYHDYKAAVERLRMIQYGHDPVSVYGCDSENEANADKVFIYDAEHDQTPATVEWLREVGGVERDAMGMHCGCDISIRFGGVDYWFRDGRYMAASLACDWKSDLHLTNHTRGDVLRLLGVFAKKEGDA